MRVCDHVENDCADAAERSGFHRRVGVGVDGKHILVRQIETHLIAPVAAQFIFPVASHRVELDDQANFGRGCAISRIGWRQCARRGCAAARVTAIGLILVTDRAFVDHRCLVAGHETGGVNRCAIRRNRQRARGVGKMRENGFRRAAQRAGCGIVGVKHPDIGAAYARRGAFAGVAGHQIGAVGAVLAAVRGGDKRTGSGVAGEHNIARLVTDQQGLFNAWRVGAKVDNTDRIRQVVDHPDFIISIGGDRYRLQTHRYGEFVAQFAGCADGVNL